MNEITVNAVPQSITTVTEFAEERMGQMGCPVKVMLQMNVVIDELFSNIARYAYGTSVGTATVRIEKVDNPEGICMTFLDSGIPFNPLTNEDPDTSLSLEEREIGGLGFFMAKKLTDQITYEYRDGRNILKVRKNFPSSGTDGSMRYA